MHLWYVLFILMYFEYMYIKTAETSLIWTEQLLSGTIFIWTDQILQCTSFISTNRVCLDQVLSGLIFIEGYFFCTDRALCGLKFIWKKLSVTQRNFVWIDFYLMVVLSAPTEFHMFQLLSGTRSIWTY